MGIRLIILNRIRMRWGDGVWKVIRVLDIPVCESRRFAGKSADISPSQSIELSLESEVIGRTSRKSL